MAGKRPGLPVIAGGAWIVGATLVGILVRGPARASGVAAAPPTSD